VLRVIARMNVGGPAYHVSLLSGRLDPERFETLLLTGNVGAGEASSDDLAERYGASRIRIPTLRPELRPADDARAVRDIGRIVRAFRPDVVHTHTAKAGFVGRVAAVAAAASPRPALVHTYHGHVLEGYFGRAQTALYRQLERALARRTDRLVGVSQATVDDLVRLGIAPPGKFEVIPLGLELDRFLDLDPVPDPRMRADLGLAPDETVAIFTGRLVPIKRVDLLIDAVARARAAGGRVTLLVVGGGPLHAPLGQHAAAAAPEGAVRFLGYRRDLAELLSASDLAVLGSDNEGTPVALIEAAAAARPLVATNAGGVPDVAIAGTGDLVARGDAAGLAEALLHIAGATPEERRLMGERARAHVRTRFGAEGLLARVADLYERLLADRRR
jgi:glycosyltransferase involved in cell wall biosynthesis